MFFISPQYVMINATVVYLLNVQNRERQTIGKHRDRKLRQSYFLTASTFSDVLAVSDGPFRDWTMIRDGVLSTENDNYSKTTVSFSQQALVVLQTKPSLEQETACLGRNNESKSVHIHHHSTSNRPLFSDSLPPSTQHEV